MSPETARKIGAEAAKYNIQLSVHAPYWINLANDENLDKNFNWIRQSLTLLKEMGGTRLVVHVASQGTLTREAALSNTKRNLSTVIKRLDEAGLNDWLMCLEVMGKYSEIGNVEEICALCKLDERLIPCLDFGHINCLTQGQLATDPTAIPEIMEYVGQELGQEKLSKIHVHWSAIEFGPKGERKHNILESEWAFPFQPLAQVIREKNLSPTIICESAEIMAQDALKLMQMFNIK